MSTKHTLGRKVLIAKCVTQLSLLFSFWMSTKHTLGRKVLIAKCATQLSLLFSFWRSTKHTLGRKPFDCLVCNTTFFAFFVLKEHKKHWGENFDFNFDTRFFIQDWLPRLVSMSGMVRVASSAGSCRRCTWRDWHGWFYCPLGLWKRGKLQTSRNAPSDRNMQ